MKEEKTLKERLDHAMDYIQSGLSDMLPTFCEFQFTIPVKKPSRKTMTFDFCADIHPGDMKFHWSNVNDALNAPYFVERHLNKKVMLYEGVFVEEEKELPYGERMPAHFVCKMTLYD